MGSLGAMARGSADRYFQDEVKDTSLKTKKAWSGILGFDQKLNADHRIFFDLQRSGEETQESSIADYNGNSPERLSSGLGYEWVASEKTSYLCGVRWSQSAHEGIGVQGSQAFTLRAGTIRKFKGVELGTTLGYYRLNSRDFLSADGTRLNLGSEIDDIDFALSSSFTY